MSYILQFTLQFLNFYYYVFIYIWQQILLFKRQIIRACIYFCKILDPVSHFSYISSKENAN
jgi:hypothetical protein